MKNGFIKLYRKVLENPVVCKDGDHLAVWIYLLLDATHSERYAMFGGKKILLEPGQTVTDRRSISKALNVSESKIQRILNLFKSEQQIEQQTSTRNRLITVVNWQDYQSSEQQIERQVNINRTTSEQPLYKQECKNEIKTNISCAQMHQESVKVPYQEVVDLWNQTTEGLPKVKALSNTRRTAINRIWSESNKSLEQIEKAFRQVQSSDFLTGRSGGWTGCGFDWVVKPANWLKIIEGNYQNKGGGSFVPQYKFVD